MKHKFKKNDLTLEELNMKFIKEFEHYLLVNERMRRFQTGASRVNQERTVGKADHADFLIDRRND